MEFIRFCMRVFYEALRHSPDIAQAIIFVLFVCAGLAVHLYPPAKMVVESANIGGWQVAFYVLVATVAMRVLLAPYWIFKDQSEQVIAASETLSRISEERHFSFVDIAFSPKGTNFNRTPIWTVDRIDLRFYNLGDRTISYKIVELFYEHNGNRIIVPLPQNAGGDILGRQETNYGFETNGLTFQIFPVILLIGFRIEYDNVPPIRKRGTKRIIRNIFSSFAPVRRNIDILESDEYWVI